MITAAHARQMSEQSQRVLFDEQVGKVEEAIRRACEKGDLDCYVGFRLTETVILHFRESGFTVKNTSDQMDGDSTFISWR